MQIPGLMPYLGPYALFLILVEVSGWFPEQQGLLLVLRVVLPGLLVWFHARRGDYPELRGYRFGAATVLDVGVGFLIAAVWVGPFLWIDALPRAEEGFDAGILGPGREPLALAVRFVGFALVTPYVEELFVRSFLHRLVDGWPPARRDFRRLKVGEFTWAGFAVTVLWFTFSHVPWEWWVAAPTGALFNLWLYRRKHIGATIVSHATANATIFALVLAGPWALDGFL